MLFSCRVAERTDGTRWKEDTFWQNQGHLQPHVTQDPPHRHQGHQPSPGALGRPEGCLPAPHPHPTMTFMSPSQVRSGFQEGKHRAGGVCAGGLLGNSTCKEVRRVAPGHREEWRHGTAAIGTSDHPTGALSLGRPFRDIANQGQGIRLS